MYSPAGNLKGRRHGAGSRGGSPPSCQVSRGIQPKLLPNKLWPPMLYIHIFSFSLNGNYETPRQPGLSTGGPPNTQAACLSHSTSHSIHVSRYIRHDSPTLTRVRVPSRATVRTRPHLRCLVCLPHQRAPDLGVGPSHLAFLPRPVHSRGVPILA